MTDNLLTSEDDVISSTLDLSNQIIHVLMSRNTRNQIGISFPSSIPFNTISSSISLSLNKTIKSSYIEILKISQSGSIIEDEMEKTMYTVIFMNIPNELIDKLYNFGAKRCIFYVGLSENLQEIPILDAKPLNKDLALTDIDGMIIPYKSEILYL